MHMYIRVAIVAKDNQRVFIADGKELGLDQIKSVMMMGINKAIK